MNCKYCGSELPEGSVFCTICGQRVADAVDDEYFAPGYETPAAPVHGGYEAPAAPVYGGFEAPAAGTAYDAPAYGDYGAPMGMGESGETTAPEKTKGKGLKLGLLLGSIGLVLVVAIVILCVMLMFGGPVTDIAMAYSDLLEGGNFTVEMEIDGEEATLMVDMDPDRRELTLCGLTDGEIEFVLLDGYAINKSYDGTFYAEDISDELDDFFDEYEDFELEEIDWEELLDEIDRGLYDEASEYIDFDVLNNCLTAYYKTINDEKWLEKNAGFSEKEKRGVTYYVFDLDIYDFASASLAEFEDAFVDPDDYEEIEEALEELESDMDRVDLELSFGLDGGDPVSLEFKGDAQGDEVSFCIEFTDIGETEIDMDELEDILDDAEIR